jgi:ABC-type sugar transport system ATPase subunit
MRTRAQDEMRRLKIGIQSVDEPVVNLSGGQRQAIAVARAIAWGRRIVIMDEPTAALGVRESAMVLELIREVRNHGLAIIMVSHNLPEVFAVADRITVLRLGRTITTLATKDTSLEAIVGMMTGAVVAAA